ncbi:general secretion pathway protein GspN [Xanthobacter sp. 126]|uniref:general secretion pathway protein GspN n=1 Tax=Xanthobacter sp. 126 TaxID=1131814 RepID=UPI0012DBCBC0|nr:general secretion pathway protein GspN [Xanthobacter sp. 126]
MIATAQTPARPLPARRFRRLPLVVAGLIAGIAAASAEVEAPAPQVDFLVPGQPSARAATAPADRERGNPLWAVPIESLSATRDRPLFTPSRRPPEQPVALAPPPLPSAPPAAVSPRPQLALTGTVVSTAGSIGIFTDQASGQIVRLKVGDAHGGWTLRSVGPRDAVLHTGADAVTLALPAPGKGGPQPPRGTEGPFAAAQVGNAKPVAGQVVVPRRTKPSPADLDSSH